MRRNSLSNNINTTLWVDDNDVNIVWPTFADHARSIILRFKREETTLKADARSKVTGGAML